MTTVWASDVMWHLTIVMWASFGAAIILRVTVVRDEDKGWGDVIIVGGLFMGLLTMAYLATLSVLWVLGIVETEPPMEGILI